MKIPKYISFRKYYSSEPGYNLVPMVLFLPVICPVVEAQLEEPDAGIMGTGMWVDGKGILPAYQLDQEDGCVWVDAADVIESRD